MLEGPVPATHRNSLLMPPRFYGPIVDTRTQERGELPMMFTSDRPKTSNDPTGTEWDLRAPSVKHVDF